MGSKKIVYYSITNIDKCGANINLIWGERSNGKSYQVKNTKAIDNYLKDTYTYHDNYKDKGNIIKSIIKKGTRFILMRRWKEEITTEKIEQYFADVDIFKLTDGKFNCISYYRKILYLANYNQDTGKTERFDKIGYVVALSTEQNYAGASYLDVSDIIFEEFMSRSIYLAHEADKLMNFYSTVDRKRGTTRLWLVGNTISRVCPYLNDWELQDIIKNQKQGEIICKWLPTGVIDEDGKPIEVKLAIEYCKSTGVSSFVIGKRKDMANKGSWQTDPQPHLPKSRRCYRKLFQVYFQYQSFKFVGEYLKDNENKKDTCWFIYPYEKELKPKKFVFSDVVKIDKYWQRNIYDMSISNDRLRRFMYDTFRENNIFYANDLVGTDFKQVIDFEIKR